MEDFDARFYVGGGRLVSVFPSTFLDTKQKETPQLSSAGAFLCSLVETGEAPRPAHPNYKIGRLTPIF